MTLEERAVIQRLIEFARDADHAIFLETSTRTDDEYEEPEPITDARELLARG